MELPQQYPYNPRLRVILLVFGVGLLWIAVLWLLWGHVPTGFGLWFGLVPITLALMLEYGGFHFNVTCCSITTAWRSQQVFSR